MSKNLKLTIIILLTLSATTLTKTQPKHSLQKTNQSSFANSQKISPVVDTGLKPPIILYGRMVTTDNFQFSPYVLGLAIYLLLGGITFIFYQVKLMRFYMAFWSFNAIFSVIISIASILEVPKMIISPTFWFFMTLAFGLLFAYLGFKYPIIAFALGGFQAFRSIILLIGHAQACFKMFEKQGVYGENALYFTALLWLCSLAGIAFGIETYIRWTVIIDIRKAINLRDIIFCFNISSSVAEGIFLITINPLIGSLVHEDSLLLLQSVQYDYIMGYLISFGSGWYMIHYYLIDSKPIFPYKFENIDLAADDKINETSDESESEPSQSKMSDYNFEVVRTRSTEDLET